MRMIAPALIAALALTLVPHSTSTATAAATPSSTTVAVGVGRDSVSEPSADGDIISPNIFLDPFETIQCQNDNAAFTVETYFDYNLGGTVAMNCGTDATSGWNHIDNDHQAQWQYLVDTCRGLGGCGNAAAYQWDDVMNYAVKETLSAAVNVVPRPSNSTVCYSTPMWIADYDTGEILVNFYTAVVISQNRAGTPEEPNIVITAFFSTRNVNPC